MAEIDHGRNRYWDGCRCAPCRTDIRLWRSERAARIQAGEEEPSSHGSTGYTEGCRCEICVDGNRAYHREYYRVHGRSRRTKPGLTVRLQLSAEMLSAVDTMAEAAGTDRLTELHRIIEEATNTTA